MASGQSRREAARDTVAIRTKGQLEAEISKAVVKIEREYMGRGPDETRTYILDDVVFVRLKGVLTPAEQQLAIDPDNRHFIKQMRARLLESARPMLADVVAGLTDCQVVSMHTDISTKTGERVIVFTMERPLSGFAEIRDRREPQNA
ncbi:MAG: DUF2294 domain-containing protein [Chloroflexi bacterium]|nr:DUF2294 domain-containing protein [Chloroflexota bacterium]